MTAPILTELKDSSFFESDVSATPQFIAGDVTLTDAEGDAANGQLRVRGLLAEDIISLFNEGTAAGQIGFNAMTGEVTFGGLLIGMATGGNGSDFVIAFNGDATLAAVELVIEHLTYANLSNHPTANRTLTIDFTDGAGNTTGSVNGYVSGAPPLISGIAPLEAGAMAAGDLDGDGDQDLIFLSTAGALVFSQQTSGSFEQSTDVSITMDSPLAAGSAITVGDINSDGIADIVAVQADGSLRLFAGIGGGTFVESASGAAAITSLLSLQAGDSLAIADFNKDGFSDLVRVSAGGQITTLFNMTLYGAPYMAAAPASVTAAGRPTLADIDGDGYLDLVITLTGGELALGRNDGFGGFDFSGPNPFASHALTSPGSVAVLDINGDGVLDLVGFDGTGFSVLIGPPPVTNTLTINVVDETPPVTIGGLPVSLTFEEDAVSAAAQLLFGDLTLTNPEADLSNGAIGVAPTNNQDQISIRDQGMGVGQVGVDFGFQTVYFEGVPVATFNYSGVQLVISFSGASQAAVEAVLENLTYANASNAPQPTELRLELYDSNFTMVAQYFVPVTVNDNPEQMVLSDLATSLQIEVDAVATPVTLDPYAGLEDSEGDLDGSVFTVSGLAATDLLTLADGLEITTSGASVLFNGVAFGLVAGGQGGDLTVTLNADATTAAVSALIAALHIASPGATLGSHTLTLALTDQGGHPLIRSEGGPVSIEITVFEQGKVGDVAASLNLTLAEAATPHLLDSDVTVTGPGGSWDGARLTVTGMTPGDVVGIADGAFDIVDDKGSLYLFLGADRIGQMVDGGNSFSVHFLEGSTKAGVEAVVEALTFRNAGTPDAARTLTLSLFDPSNLLSTDQIVVKVAGGVSYAMELSDFATAVSVEQVYVNAGFVPLDAAVTLRDTNGDYAGAVLTVSGAAATDILGFSNNDIQALYQDPNGDLLVNFSTVIGHVSGGLNGDPLTVTFAAGVTTAQVELVLENLALRTDDTTPEANRTLTLSLQNNEGEALHRIGETGPVTLSFEIEIAAPPLIVTGLGFNGVLDENLLNYQGDFVLPDAILTSAGGLPGGRLVVKDLQADDGVTIRSNNHVGYNSATGEVSYDGQVIATTARVGSEFTLTFGDVTDSKAIETVLRSVALLNSNDNPTSDLHSLSVFLYGADGQVATAGWKYTIQARGEVTQLSLTPAATTFDEQLVNAGPRPLVADAEFFPQNEPVPGAILTVGGLAAGDRVTLLNGAGLTFDDQTGEIFIAGAVIAHAVVTDGVSLVVTFTDQANRFSVDTVLKTLGFSTSSDTPAATRTLTLGLVNVYGHPALLSGLIAPTLTVNVTPFHDPMALSDLATSVTHAENSLNAGAQLIDSAVTLFGPDTSWLDGSLSITSDDPADSFGLQANARVSLSGNDVLVDGVVVATAVVNDGALTVSFLAAATTPAVEQIIEALAWRNTGDTPAASRDASLTILVDGESIQTTISLNITPQDDPAVVTGLGSVTVQENTISGPGQLVLPGVSFTDVDGFAGQQLVIHGLAFGFVLGLQAQGGDAAIADIRANQTVSYGGASLTFVSGPFGDVIVNLNGATAAQIQTVLANMILRNPDDVAALTMNLNFTFEDQSGVSVTVEQIVGIEAQYDPVVLTDVAAAVTFGEQAVSAAPQLLDAAVTLSNLEGTMITGLTVSGLLPEDLVSLRSDDHLVWDSGTGEITLDGELVGSATGGVGGTFNVTVEGADVLARQTNAEIILEHLAYGNVSDHPTASRTLTFQILDSTDASHPPAPVQIVVNVTDETEAPSFTDFGPVVVYENAVNAGYVPVDGAVSFHAPDTPSFAGGSLSFATAEATGFVSLDVSGRLAFGFGGIGLRVDGQLVSDTYAGGPDIQFNANVTAADIEAIVEAARYRNSDQAPDGADQITITLTDSTGAVSQTRHDVTIVAENDPTVLTGIGGVTLQEAALQAGGQLLLPQLSFTDVDEVGSGQHIIIRNLPDEFTLSLAAQGGDPAVGDLRTAGVLSYGGATLFVASPGGATGDIIVHLNGATVAQVQTFLANLTIANASDFPYPLFNLSFEIVGSSGAFNVLHQVAVEQQFDPTTLTEVTASHTFGEQAVNAGPQLLDAAVTLTTTEFRPITGLTVSGLLAEDRVTLLGDAHLSWNRTTGAITLDGVLIGNATGGVGGDFNITVAGLNPLARLANAEAILEHLAYANVSNRPTESRTLSIQVIETPPPSGDFVPAAPVSVTVNVTPYESPTVLTFSGFEATVDSGDHSAFATAISVVDTDGFDIGGAVLRITGLPAGDTLYLQATVGGITSQSGQDLYRGSVLVGSLSLIDGGVALTFTADATVADINNAVHQLQWTSQTPWNLGADHSFQAVLDLPGAAPDQSVSFEVHTHAPLRTTLVSFGVAAPGQATVHENAANAGLTAIDLGGFLIGEPTNFQGGHLHIDMAYVVAGETFEIVNRGTGAGQIGSSNGVVTYGGVAIGTVTTGVSGGARVIDVSFNSNVTPIAVEALLAAIGFSTTSNTPLADRTLGIALTPAPYLLDASLVLAGGPLQLFKEANLAPFYQSPTVVDYDADGDLDILYTRDFKGMGLALNTGTAQAAHFVEMALPGFAGNLDPSAGNPANAAVTSVIDFDGDGDLDIVAGRANGTIAYFQNTGGPGMAGAWTQRTGAANPFNGLDFNPGSSAKVSPVFGDLDGDGDLDMLVNGPLGTMRFDNVGTRAAPVFQQRDLAINAVATSRPFLGDLDGDGDLDILYATDLFTLYSLENLGGGVFGAPDYFARVYDASSGATLDEAVLADLNGDGVPELQISDVIWYLQTLSGGPRLYQPGPAYFFTTLTVINEAEVINGTPGDDTLNGDANDNVINGLAGNDIIDGKGGPDLLNGGLGNDTYMIDTLDTVVELDGEGVDTVKAAFTYTLGNFVENLTLLGSTALNGTGNALANLLTGNAAANTLMGLDGNDAINAGAGNDILDGGAGDDNLSGGLGADLMRGGLGNDIYAIDNAGDVADETGGDGVDLVNSALTWTLAAGLENLTLTGKTATQDGTGNDLANVLTGTATINTLTGLAGNDTLLGLAGEDILIGGDGDDLLDGGLGADAMLGGLGNDTYIIDNIDDFAVEIGGGGIDTIQSKISWTMGLGIENLVFTVTGAVDGIGNAVNNVITGNLSNNRLSGMAGDDQLIGAAGNDTLDGGDGNDILDGGVGIDILTGGAGTDTLTAGDGNDSLDGGTGADHMDGGLGNDTYFVDNILDVIVDAGGVDLVNASSDYVLAGDLEHLTLTGTGDTAGTANALANTVIGNSGANVLHAGAGIDTVSGMGGADTLYGDAGIDTLLGGDGNDRLYGGLDADKLTGGLGADAFVFTGDDIRLSGAGLLADRDAIYDLTFADGDVLDLSAIDANTLLAGDQAFSFAAKFTKVAGQATLKFAAGITTLELDSDGDGKADFRIAITGDHSLTGANLYTGAGDTNGGWIL